MARVGAPWDTKTTGSALIFEAQSEASRAAALLLRGWRWRRLWRFGCGFGSALRCPFGWGCFGRLGSRLGSLSRCFGRFRTRLLAFGRLFLRQGGRRRAAQGRSLRITGVGERGVPAFLVESLERGEIA